MSLIRSELKNISESVQLGRSGISESFEPIKNEVIIEAAVEKSEDMGLLGKIFGESKRTQEYNLKLEAIKRDIALKKNNTVDTADNLILATMGIDQQGGIVNSNNSVKVAVANAVAGTVSSLGDSIASAYNPFAGKTTVIAGSETGAAMLTGDMNPILLVAGGFILVMLMLKRK